MSDQAVAVHYQHMEEWLNDRKSVFARKNKKEFAALMELAPRLVQLIQYDVPALQRQSKKTDSVLDECHRVCEDAERVAMGMEDKKRKFLIEYDLDPEIQGSNDLLVAVDQRISTSGDRLHLSLSTYAHEHLGPFREAYEGFLTESAPARFGEGTFRQHFPWLSCLDDEKGLPVRSGVQQQSAADDEADQCAAPQAIDWGDDEGTVSVDLGYEPPAVDINWGEDDDVALEATKCSELHEDDQLPPSGNGTHLSLDLFTGKHRVNLVTELTACCCFAVQRKEEGDTRFDLFATATDDIIHRLTTSSDAEFLRMRQNFRAREAFEERVYYYDRTVAAAQLRRTTHHRKIEETRTEAASLEPRLAALLQEAKDIRDTCVRELSVLFPGRKVVIAGDINKYL